MLLKRLALAFALVWKRESVFLLLLCSLVSLFYVSRCRSKRSGFSQLVRYFRMCVSVDGWDVHIRLVRRCIHSFNRKTHIASYRAKYTELFPVYAHTHQTHANGVNSFPSPIICHNQSHSATQFHIRFILAVVRRFYFHTANQSTLLYSNKFLPFRCRLFHDY